MLLRNTHFFGARWTSFLQRGIYVRVRVREVWFPDRLKMWTEVMVAVGSRWQNINKVPDTGTRYLEREQVPGIIEQILLVVTCTQSDFVSFCGSWSGPGKFRHSWILCIGSDCCCSVGHVFFSCGLANTYSPVTEDDPQNIEAGGACVSHVLFFVALVFTLAGDEHFLLRGRLHPGYRERGWYCATVGLPGGPSSAQTRARGTYFKSHKTPTSRRLQICQLTSKCFISGLLWEQLRRK